MSKEKLVAIIQKLLEADADLDFLLELKEEQLEKLTACIRNRLGDIEGFLTIRKGLISINGR
ncbi:MAG: hypothetical protein H8E17_11000 [Deltaproteobacteria bacterium]|nr:hypothetical protein [Deltaproteobacteria bacterium]